MNSQNLSHEERHSTFEESKKILVEKVISRGNLPHVTVDKQLEIIELASKSELGKFLIQKGGLNGYWTHYVITYPNRNRAVTNAFEDLVLKRAPVSLATQQRFVIFKNEIQKRLTEGCQLASIPSGLMGDLLDLDYSKFSDFTLYGIDLDQETLSQAAIYAHGKKLVSHCQFSQKDAWDLKMNGKFDLISSNGLNVYVKDHAKSVDLYREFYNSLKPNGTLVTSFFTTQSEWKMDQINPEDALLQKILVTDLLSAKWQIQRAEAEVIAQLKEAGFNKVEVIYDKAHIYPTVIATK